MKKLWLTHGRRLAHVLFTYVFIIVVIILAYSVFRSGYHYTFDYDELHHAQLVWLYAHGYKPFLDIYNAVYTPPFEWVIGPVYRLFGFTIQAIQYTRWVMIALFVVRIAAGYLLVRRIFGKLAAALFIPVYLLDPFTVFSGMQIRPDNLMTTIFIAGILFLALGESRRSLRLTFLAGAFISASPLVLLKTAPSVIATAVIFAIYSILRRQWKNLGVFSIGFLLSPILFSLYFASYGAFGRMIQEVIIESVVSYNTFQFPVQLGFFYAPNNSFIYGLPGKPLTWIYAWILPITAFAGLYHILHTVTGRGAKDKLDSIRIMLCTSLILQWGALFFYPSVFIQHYLPVSWLFAVFTAVCIAEIIAVVRRPLLLHYAVWLTLIVIFIALVRTSYAANLVRAGNDSRDVVNKVNALWQIVPDGTYVFPSVLFRPQAYPDPYGYPIANIAPEVLARLPKIPDALEQYQVPILLLDDYMLRFLSYDDMRYIKAHYRQDKQNPIVYRRI